jgi:hypothetical protein
MYSSYKDYSDAVRASCKQMRQEKQASWLLLPTPAKLRDECVNVFRTRYTNKDEECLKNFFGVRANQNAYLKAIEQCNIGKFKPVISFMTKDNHTPKEKVIELLAWLIDFQPRPYVRERVIITDDYEMLGGTKRNLQPVDLNPHTATGGDTPTVERQQRDGDSFILKGDDSFPGPPSSGKPYSLYKKIAVLALAVVVIVAGLFGWQFANKPPKTVIIGQQKCMFWAGYEYKLVSCDQKLGNTLVIAWDSLMLAQLKKISRPDTITKQHIGKVWYIRRNGRVECFTAGGAYPPDPKYRLRPITNTIVDNYIRKGLVWN